MSGQRGDHVRPDLSSVRDSHFTHAVSVNPCLDRCCHTIQRAILYSPNEMRSFQFSWSIYLIYNNGTAAIHIASGFVRTRTMGRTVGRSGRTVDCQNWVRRSVGTASIQASLDSSRPRRSRKSSHTKAHKAEGRSKAVAKNR